MSLQVLGKDYQAVLAKLIPKTHTPRALGGTSDASLGDSPGPWNDFQHLEGCRPPGPKESPLPPRGPAVMQSIDAAPWMSCRWVDAVLIWGALSQLEPSSRPF